MVDCCFYKFVEPYQTAEMRMAKYELSDLMDRQWI
jgi:hypothetical protein